MLQKQTDKINRKIAKAKTARAVRDLETAEGGLIGTQEVIEEVVGL